MFSRKSPKKDMLLYVISKMKISGRLKLMKIMFFLEHLNIETDKLVSKTLFVGNEFIIYRYGPFSFDVVRSLEECKNDHLIEESTPDDFHIIPSITESGKKRIEYIEKSLNPELKKRIHNIKDKLDKFEGDELEKMSLEYLKISRDEKKTYQGVSVSELLKEKN